jgi:hypothetical protein
MVEDAETIGGLKLKEMTAGEIFGKLIGFVSSDLSDYYDQTNTVRSLDKRRRDRRGHLLDLVVQAYDSNSPASIKTSRKAILEWNKRNPQHPINMKNIISARRGRAMNEARSTFGVRETRKNRDLVNKFDFAS